MSYTVLARKWRPQTFTDLVGQEHVAQTLRNAIVQNRIAHAMLFTGARGVGKTTIARIMAKALNCLARDGASAEPCLKCAACTEIAEGRDPDVREIDGATNNGVDDVRALQETLPYRPQRDRFKVVIVDECHMISPAGWNAFLKTLEEPPPHVKFIFATTEVHKVLATILSRVQRYDFRLIPTQRIRERLAHILRAEGIASDDAAVSLVAREAAGSLRDALSLLDQVIAGVGGEITGPSAARLLGVADHKALYDLARAMIGGDAPAGLRLVDAVTREGYDLTNVARSVHQVLRDLVVARVVSNPGELLDLADDERAEVLAIARAAEPADLERLFVAWSRVVEEVARAREPRWSLEMAVVRLSHRPALIAAEELMTRLGELERRLASGGAPPPPEGSKPPGTGGAGVPRPPGGGAGPRPGGPLGAAGASAATTTAAVQPGRFTPPTVRGGGGDPVASANPDGPAAMAVAMGAAGAAAVMTPSPAMVPAVTAKAAEIEGSWLSRARQNAPEFRVAAKANEAPERAAPSGPVAERIDVSGAAAALPVWRTVVEAVEGNMVPVLRSVVPLEVSGARVRLAVSAASSFIRKKLETPEAQAVVQEAALRVFGQRPEVTLLQGALDDDAPTIAWADDRAKAAARAEREATARAHPMVTAVCEVLGAEVMKVKLADEPS